MNRLKWPPAVVLSLLFVLCMLPFIDKAVHIDDPLFLWSAARILHTPADFYGIVVNWYGWDMPLHEVMQNPPLTSYYLAFLLLVGGGNLLVAHLGMLLPGVCCILGVYRMAGLFCRSDWLATLMFMTAPCFFIASDSFMADLPLCCLWVWSVYLYMKGELEGSVGKRCLAALLLGAAVLVKYNALALVPLLFTYSLLKQRRLRSLLPLLFPLLVALGYHLTTTALYGHSLLFQAMSYSWSLGDINRAIETNLFVGLTFLGGNILICLIVSPWTWRKQGLVGLVIIWFCSTLLILLHGGLGKAQCEITDALSWGFAVQAGLFIAAGIHIHALAWEQFVRHRDAESILLLLWITGQCVFAFFLNWSITSRTLLPLAPAAAILAVRGMEKATAPLLSNARTVVPVACSALLLALAVTYCDYNGANATRAAVLYIAKETKKLSVPVWFGGHWGWQYYAEQFGMQPLNHRNGVVHKGDLLALPLEILQKPIPINLFSELYEFSLPSCSGLSVKHEKHLAGFHSDEFGPLPFIFAPTRDYRFRIYVAPISITFTTE